MNARKYLVEFIGAFFLILTVGMTVFEPGAAGPLAIPAIAAVLTVMVYAGGHVSGAHYNPAVTIGVWLRGKCPIGDVMPYIVAQCLAAAAAGAVVLYLKVGEQITPREFDALPAVIAEFVFTFALVYVVLNVATAKATAGNSYYGLAIGLTVLGGAIAASGVSGGVLNPAVAVGLGVMGRLAWPDIWIFLTGEVLGAVAAVAVFKAVVRDQS